MRPRIDHTEFGSITIEGSDIEHDVLVRLSGKVKKRKKKLSKAVFGTSHTLSLEEAEHIYEQGADRLIIGSGGALWSAEDADLYVDAAGGYPVGFSGKYSGAFEPLQFEGDFSVQTEVTSVNTNPRIDLPSSCNRPIVK